ncbi:saccharopine dehydrogenase family protein [Fervidibacillus halotolerans]|uniref:Saccharopine dehydrogenase NADP-binding domain-containing protein n=1 Tax=Fervidibacillus halotolerans TaxID=2980027 RepID=A0A9E8M113_9BACI|nr:saccharopine dehydrogenase C-terminal domain-containing protein [Fervidibacillus halotolerans]WAA13480.1 saccharopine dehydrogenase NADP-binding domain-containing protein [Fervidibacillus halotolerans]
MKIAVLGAGLMGKEAARDLVESSEVKQVGLADIDYEKAKEICQGINHPKLKAYQLDASNEHDLAKLMKNYDVVINALFYKFNKIVAKTAIKTGTHSVDLGGHIQQITDEILEWKEEAKKANVTIIPDLGVAPGMINILAGYGASKLTETKSVKLYVGGIPLRPEPPLYYNHVFSLDGLMDHYSDPARIIRNGKQMTVPSLSEIETVYFDKFGPLEAFHTSGGTSTLPKTFPNLDGLEYKTIRYPGHAKNIQLLKDLQLLSNEPIHFGDSKSISPREMLLKVLAPRLSLKEKDQDVVLLRVIVSGKKSDKQATITYEMVTYKDEEKGITAMAKATAGTISVVAQMIGNGTIGKRGVFAPEEIVPGDLYIKEMKKRNVHIVEHFEYGTN